jgi:uncharacterized protein YndB with AHSA1/START domain
MTMISEFAASADRVWQVWENPRTLERWWGPPTHPATFVSHDFVAGGRSSYYMTSPEGDKYWGWWGITATAAPAHAEFTDGFADANGEPDNTIDPTQTAVDLVESDGTTRMTVVTTFTSVENLEQLLAMGMEEGLRQSMGQIDALLA